MNAPKIKILHIISPGIFGGAERILLSLSENIDKEAFDLVFSVCVNKNNCGDFLEKKLLKLGFPCEAVKVNSSHDIRQYVKIFQVIKKHHPKIIHTHGYKTNILGMLFAKLFRIPIITTVHGWYVKNKKMELLVRVSLILMRYFDGIIVVSDRIKMLLVKMKIPINKIITIRNISPVDIEKNNKHNITFREELGIEEDKRVIGFLGRLEEVKGCDLLLKAIAKICIEEHDFSLVIVGDGPQRKLLDNLSKKLNISDLVYFCGFRDDPIKVLQSIDLLVLPSRSEGIPLVMLEAMSLGVPVVATKVGGIPEVIKDKINGVLVNPENPDDLAKSILDVLVNEEETALRSLEAKRTINFEYNAKTWKNKIQAFYTKIASVSVSTINQ